MDEYTHIQRSIHSTIDMHPSILNKVSSFLPFKLTTNRLSDTRESSLSLPSSPYIHSYHSTKYVRFFHIFVNFLFEVCTSQYFVWYISFLPVISSRIEVSPSPLPSSLYRNPFSDESY